MHCEDAPCETVCPVAATVHSAEGLNQMIYNRCVGTRYCSNNCPYKVRRFNFFLYSDFKTELFKMQRNPEGDGAQPRRHGEVHLLRAADQPGAHRGGAREPADRDGENRHRLPAGVPGPGDRLRNIDDPQSAVSRRRAEKRRYSLLAELGTRPRTTYLASITNPNPELPGIAKTKPEREA
jgi:molybdopterin-containing oxidoreductase family iron-sulfur binding subunit